MPLSQVLPAVNEEAQFGEKLREFWTTDWSDWAAWLYAMLDVTYRNIPQAFAGSASSHASAEVILQDGFLTAQNGNNLRWIIMKYPKDWASHAQCLQMFAGLVKSCYRCCQVLEKSVASEHLGAPVLVMSRPVQKMGMPGIDIAFHECPVCCYFAAA